MNTKTKIKQMVFNDQNIKHCCFELSYKGIHDPDHASRRQQQRAISEEMIWIALTYGRKQYRHGATLFTLDDRRLSRTPYMKFVECLRGLRVVCQPSERSIDLLTVYWVEKIRRRSYKLA